MATILVVEDDQDFNNVLAEFLATHGHDVYQAFDGNQAYQHFIRNQPDLVISDVLMPNEDGLEFLQKISNSKELSVKGIIMISGGGLGEASYYLNVASTLGATAVLQKPIEFHQLLETITMILDQPIVLN